MCLNASLGHNLRETVPVGRLPRLRPQPNARDIRVALTIDTIVYNDITFITISLYRIRF